MILYFKYDFRKTKCFWCFSSAAFFSVEIFISSTSSLIVLYSARRQFYLTERCNNPPARQRLQPACRPSRRAKVELRLLRPRRAHGRRVAVVLSGSPRRLRTLHENKASFDMVVDWRWICTTLYFPGSTNMEHATVRHSERNIVGIEWPEKMGG